VFTVRNVQVKFGEGVSSEIGYEAKRLLMTKVLVVTDSNLCNQTKIPEYIVGKLEEAGLKVDLYDGTHIEPIDIEVIKGIERARGQGYDGFIGLGGGSSIDTAKMINLYTTYPTEKFKDYISPPTGKGKPVPGPLKPLIAIPTTAGTGSENTPVAVVDLLEEKIKVAVSNQYLLPSFALLDPVLSVSLPPYYTSSTGMDALLHSIEAYTCIPYNSRKRPINPSMRPVYVGSNPVSDMFALKSIELIGHNLRLAYHSPTNLKARHNMLLGAHLGGAFGNAGVHIPHALSYPLAGRKHDLPHGIAVCITGVASLEFLEQVIPEKLGVIANLLGEDTTKLSKEKAASVAKDRLISLMKDINFPSGIAELGFDEKDIDELGEAGLKVKRLLACCPRPVNLEDIKDIYRKSLYNW
jgi:hydroxyacid-oxoacid transhydrogenase